MSDTAEIKIGRPSIFTDELALRICERIAGGELLIKICREDEMPAYATIFRWLEEKTAFREAYARARREQADFFVEDTVEISDEEPDANRARVRVMTRQWLAERLNASKYGAKVALTGHDGGPLAVSVVRYDLPAQVPGDGAKVIEHAAAHEATPSDQAQVIEKKEGET